MCRVYNETAKYVNQGGKRNGSIAVYIELHHPDILEFLDLRKNNGIEDQRCRDLFLALMVSDLFMKKLEYNLKNPDDEVLWYLFDPDRCPELNNCYGEEYEKLYNENIKNNKYTKSIPILTLARKICSSQIETGTPYILFKDRINKLSNQKNIGIIRSSNLCAEIVEYSDDKEYACCCLSSISLPSFVYKPKIKEKIKIYTKTKCKYCKMLKKELDHYEEINLDNDDERFKFYTEISKKVGKTISTVPQIFIGDKYIGSYDDFKKYNKNKFNFELLEKCCKIIVRGLNNVVDKNKYPIIETKISNFRHRPLGIGVQGFADLLFKMKYSFESKNARDLNREIFEHIQYFCLKYSMEISKFRYSIMNTDEFEKFARKSIDSVDKLQFKYHPNERLPNIFTFYYKNEMFTYVELLKYFELKDRDKKYFGAYSTFEGSPLSKGLFQYELANEEPVYVSKDKWDELRKNIIEYGVRNSQLIALMPTASTSQILGNNECFEPITSNIYTRRTLAGDFIKINKYLVNDLGIIGLWNNDLKDEIIANNGSIQKFDFIPNEIKEIYKTSWEIKQKSIIDLAADRTPFICQTQSMNLFFEEPTNSILVSSMLYGWKRGLKTGSYYIRSRPKVKAQQFTIDPRLKKSTVVKEIKNETCDFCSG